MKKAFLALTVIAGVGYGVVRWQGAETPAPRDDASLVTDRLWIDHIPRSDKDVVQVFAALTQEPVGVFQATSQWKGEFEVFRYEQHGNELRMLFPQTGTRDRVKAKATECDRGGMDYCLELQGASHGVKRYYSREGWEIGSIRDVNTLARTLAQ